MQKYHSIHKKALNGTHKLKHRWHNDCIDSFTSIELYICKRFMLSPNYLFYTLLLISIQIIVMYWFKNHWLHNIHTNLTLTRQPNHTTKTQNWNKWSSSSSPWLVLRLGKGPNKAKTPKADLIHKYQEIDPSSNLSSSGHPAQLKGC